MDFDVAFRTRNTLSKSRGVERTESRDGTGVSGRV